MSGDVHRDNLILTVRVIRSFEHRNIWHVVMRDVSSAITTEEFKKEVLSSMGKNTSMPSTVRTYPYDTLKIEHLPHKAKSNDPVINTDDDDKLILLDHVPLLEGGVVHETVLSLFKMDDYLQYKASKLDQG
ncbi:hypothetical protein HPB50_020235 [Hyalomma asiaticum]|uniref:Uncharacterized protein n=1 Tax=Hyalomma asiaticum TaxID=266040 RepID=A0ACB7T0W5_HYAAI|nr:hypothetical protein HPB50_020235 [Hyalomma asiaticum]